MQARKDVNHKSTLLGVSSVDLVTPIRLRTDPITGRLLVAVADTQASGTPVLRKNAKFDENHKYTMLGWNGTATQALITHNGFLALKQN